MELREQVATYFQRMSFADLVEEVRALPIEAKEELQEVLRHELIEVERERLYQDHMESVQLYHNGKLPEPTSDVDELIRRLEQE